MKGADAIAEILKREGTEYVVCYPNQLLIEACALKGIRPITLNPPKGWGLKVC